VLSDKELLRVFASVVIVGSAWPHPASATVQQWVRGVCPGTFDLVHVCMLLPCSAGTGMVQPLAAACCFIHPWTTGCMPTQQHPAFLQPQLNQQRLRCQAAVAEVGVCGHFTMHEG
jgi:hypothetical protein